MNTNTTAVTATVPSKTSKLSIHPKAILLSVVLCASTLSTTASAALDSTVVDGIVAEVLSDVTMAVSAGFGVLAVVLASTIGFSLIGTFIRKGASGG